jgi:transcriptional regulator with XRE-family HTH domain
MTLSDFHSERLRQRIVSLRKQRNLSQRDIAQALGITDQTVSNWEQGRSEPRLTIRQTALLCRILDCNLSDLDDLENS